MGRSRVVACLLVAIYAAAQWMAHAHIAAVHHVRCAEHDELVDVPDLAFPDAGDRSIHSQGSSDARGDHHCITALHVGAAIEHLEPSIAIVAQLADAPLATWRDLESPRARVIGFAPKTSPPA